MEIIRSTDPAGHFIVLRDAKGTLLASVRVEGNRTVYFDGVRQHPERTHENPRKALGAAGIALVDRACREIAKARRFS